MFIYVYMYIHACIKPLSLMLRPSGHGHGPDQGDRTQGRHLGFPDRVGALDYVKAVYYYYYMLLCYDILYYAILYYAMV